MGFNSAFKGLMAMREGLFSREYRDRRSEAHHSPNAEAQNMRRPNSIPPMARCLINHTANCTVIVLVPY